MTVTRRLAALALFAGLALAGAPALADVLDPCAPHIYREERNLGIPAHLMRAVALAESGRWLDETRSTVAWPWTINAEGVGHFYPSKEAAIAAVRQLQARGVRSIDVGCMQVNLHWHQNAFRSLEEAFEPMSNVAYAAHYLAELKAERQSWDAAVRYYHSADPGFNQPYGEKVERLWASVRTDSSETATRFAAGDNSSLFAFRGAGASGTAWWLKPGWVNPSPKDSFVRVAAAGPGSIGLKGQGLDQYRQAPVQPTTTGPRMRLFDRP
jgi:hypothetical protein